MPTCSNLSATAGPVQRRRVMSLIANCGQPSPDRYCGVADRSWFSEATVLPDQFAHPTSRCSRVSLSSASGARSSGALNRIPSQLRGLKDGLCYAWHTLPIRFLLRCSR